MINRVKLQFKRLLKFSRRYNALQRFDNIDVLIDVGVFKGTKWLYQHIRAGKLVLIDPNLSHFDTAAFDLTNVECIEIEAAVGSGNGIGYLNWNPGEFARASVSESPILQSETRKIDIQSVDSIITKARISSTDNTFLKVDVEGMELEVVSAFLDSGINIKGICVEIAAEDGRGDSSLANISNLCSKHGFKFVGITELRRNHDGQMTVADFIFESIHADR